MVPHAVMREAQEGEWRNYRRWTRSCSLCCSVLRVSEMYHSPAFLGWQVGEVYAPHALPMFREEQNSKKRKERSDRKDPVRSKKPDPPVRETRLGGTRRRHETPSVFVLRLLPPLCSQTSKLMALFACWCTDVRMHGRYF